MLQDGKDIYAGMQTLSIKKDKEEPEHMRKWKEEQQERLMKKDQEESAAMEELKVKAKQELEDWYKRYETQVEKTKSSNREEETKYEIGEMNGIEPGTEWERVSKHCDFSSKVLASFLSKIRDFLYFLLSGTWSHKRRLENEVNSASTQAKSDGESLDSQTNSEVRNCIYFIKYFCTGDSFNISYYHNS